MCWGERFQKERRPRALDVDCCATAPWESAQARAAVKITKTYTTR